MPTLIPCHIQSTMLYLCRLASILVLLFLTACSTRELYQKKTPAKKIDETVTINPNHHNNICKIFEQAPDWYDSALKAEKRWNIPVHVLIAVMKQESSFRARARPLAKKTNNTLNPAIPLSSAYGYAQAKTNTWRDYQKKTQQLDHRRDVFDHSVDFIGWYSKISTRLLSLKNYDTYSLYLAYHEGWTGYKRKSYDKKLWLKEVAKKVRNVGYSYHKQLKGCSHDFNTRTKKPAKPKSVVASYEKRKTTKANTSTTNGCSKVLGFWPFCSPFSN